MARPGSDPYEVLGVSSDVSDEGLRAAYRRLVQLHHPDHNGGSPEAARRFEQVQDAYALVTRMRQAGSGRRQAGSGAGQPPRADPSPGAGGRRPAADPDLESKLADIERQVREAQAARERAQRAAREAAASTARRPTDEELGYYTTDDSFSKLFDDAAEEVSKRLAGAGQQRAKRRAANLFDELAARLRGEDRSRSGE